LPVVDDAGTIAALDCLIQKVGKILACHNRRCHQLRMPITRDDYREQRGRKRSFTDADAARFGLKDAAQLHRPGWRHSPNVYARDAAIDAYSDYERELAGAYLLPQQGKHTGVGSHGPVEQRTGRLTPI
jgi:hypothetical protein